MRQDGKYEYLKGRHGFVLAGMEDLPYRKEMLQLQPGDKNYLYTDGVTEATDLQQQLYGEERLLNILNAHTTDTVEEICKAVKADVDAFVGDAPQFDDITMLCFAYEGTNMNSKTVDLSLGHVAPLTELVETTLEEGGASMATIIKMNIALDEIYSNIVKFSGGSYATISCGIEGDMVVLTFGDDGIPYNRLTKEDADTTLSAEEREIGGLGILMVKKSMDQMEYHYENDKNLLVLKKKR